MSKLMHTPYRIGNIVISNRIVKSAMFEYCANQGRITDQHRQIYEDAARGGCGLIITGMEAISSTAGNGPGMIHTEYDGYLEDMRSIVAKVHRYSSRIFVQLQHAGPRTDWKSGYDRFASSPIKVADGIIYHAATKDELAKVVHDFGVAARKCKLAGCDGVQIHAAHGFLLTTFLSPHFNKRADEYGGPIENRSRLLFEIYDSVRNAVGVDYPIALKLSFSDLVSDSSTPEEMLWVCKELEKKGIDFIEVSSGISADNSGASCSPVLRNGDREGKFLESALLVSDTLEIPVSSVGCYRSPDFIEHILSSTSLTAISLGRPLVREADLPNKWRTSNEKAACISCNRCFNCTDVITCLCRKK